jgi:glycosyltransferase involved in cell wall biosynthesis
VIRQSYGNVEILVSDNASSKPDVQKFLNEISTRYPGIQVFIQEKNIGPVDNFMFLLTKAHGEYFMWLADDDEISENYVSSLVQVLQEHPDAVTAMGQWILVRGDGSQTRMDMDTSIFPEKSVWRRLMRYCWKSKDVFYYGLHRTDALRSARFSKYWWPNQHILLNSTYIYLFDLVVQGRILLSADKTACWINHYYTDKTYRSGHGGGIGVLATAVRRLNIYSCYFLKALKWGKFTSAATLIVVAPLAWIRDVRKPFSALLRAIPRKVADIASR